MKLLPYARLTDKQCFPFSTDSPCFNQHHPGQQLVKCSTCFQYSSCFVYVTTFGRNMDWTCCICISICIGSGRASRSVKLRTCGVQVVLFIELDIKMRAGYSDSILPQKLQGMKFPLIRLWYLDLRPHKYFVQLCFITMIIDSATGPLTVHMLLIAVALCFCSMPFTFCKGVKRRVIFLSQIKFNV